MSSASPSLPIEYGPIDVSASLRWSVLWRQSDGTPWVEVARSADGYFVRVIGFADFCITSTAVRVAPREGSRPSTIRHLLLDQVFPLFLTAEGQLVLHASGLFSEGQACPERSRRVIAIAGHAGTGKSTLASALQREGWSVASDDGLLLREQASEVVAVPAYPGLRLWPDAAERTGVMPFAVSEVAEYTAKLRVSLAATKRLEPAPLAGVYVIQHGDAVKIEPLTARDATMVLIEQAYRADLTDRAALAAQLDACARLATRVRVCRLVMPRDLAQLAAVAGVVNAHARVETT